MIEFSSDFQKLGYPLTKIWLGPYPIINAFTAESVKVESFLSKYP